MLGHLHTAARLLVARPRVTRRCSSTLPTLRKFLLEVHPDMLPAFPEAKRVNGVNVATLQAYLRESTYVGSANLLFYRKPAPDGTELREARVVVGRGVAACVDSMAVALGGSAAPRRRPRPAPRPPPPRRAGAGAVPFRAPPAPVDRNRSLAAYGTAAKAPSLAALRERRRAAAHVDALARRVAERTGLARVDNRCNWTARPLAGLLRRLDAAAGARRLDGFDVVFSTTEPRECVDAREGLIVVSPSRADAAWRETLDRVTGAVVAARAAAAADEARAVAGAEAALAAACGGPVVLERGATCGRGNFSDACAALAAALPAPAAPPGAGAPRRLRLERDAVPAPDGDGRVVASLRAARDADAVVARLRAAAPRPDARRDLESLARTCAEELGLRDLELFLAGAADTIAVAPSRAARPGALVRSGRVAGARPGALRDALARLRDRPPPFLAGLSVGLGAPGRPIVESDHGQLVLPTDAIR